MFALAIARDPKPEQINLYGIDMVDGTEWGPQRPDLMRFIGHAREAGIAVVIPEECALFREGGFSFYAYDEADTADKYDRMIKEFQKRINHYQARMEALDKDNEYALAMCQTTNGAAQAIAKLIEDESFGESRAELEKIAAGYRQQADEHEARTKYLNNEMGQTDGMLQECHDWIRGLTQGDRGWP
jgi:hypothetical protein